VNALLIILAVLAYIGGIACFLVIVVDAFRDELWKGFVALLCGLYFIYYALVEYDHDWKWAIVLGAIAGNAIGTGLMGMATGRGFAGGFSP
jgi:uncharacterized membrane protein YhaH (DUF805 family)